MFLPKAVVVRARSDRSHPRDEILRRLEDHCKHHLELTPDSLVQMRGKSWLRWRITIEELSAMAALSPGGVHLEHLVDIVSPMARGGWRTASGFERHLSVPFVLTALAGCFDTHYDDLGRGRSAIEDVVVELTEFLANQQMTTRWGDPDRIAFNHVIIAYAALGVAALALLEHHPDAPSWLELALDRCRRFLEVGLTSAGMTWEGLTYCGFDFKYLGVLLCGLRDRGLEAELVPRHSHIEQKLERVPIWYAHEMLPKGCYLQNCNESPWDPHRALWGFLLSFSKYKPGLCATIWDRLVGANGLQTYGAHYLWSSLAEAMFFYPETERTSSLELLDDVFFAPEVGYVSARDSWTEDATVFTFNAGPHLERAEVHDQADNNSFALVACGTPMVIDSGDANDLREGSPSSSLGHNLILIDGVAEHPTGGAVGVSGRIVAFGCTEEAVCVVGDATESYRYRGYNPIQHARRTALFVRRPFPYVLIHDDIKKDEADHLYEFIVHVPDVDEASLATRSRLAIVHDADGSPTGTIEVLRPVSVRVQVDTFQTYSDPYRDHRLLRVATRAVNPQFVVLLQPLPATEERPIVGLKETVEGLEVTLGWSATVDKIVLRYHTSDARRRGDSLPIFSRSTSGWTPHAWAGRYEARAPD